MKDVLLSNERLIRSVAGVNDNVSTDYLMTSLREAQNINLKRILGGSLMKKLLKLVEDAQMDAPENAKYKELVEQCQYYLAYMTVVNLTYKTTYKITNFGVVKSSDENLQVLTFDEVVKVRDYYQSKVDFYAIEIQKFVKHYRESFPELSQDDYYQINHNLMSAASCGIFLGGPRGVK